MRFVTWNIQSGGGQRIPSIVQALEQLQADLVALTEVTYNNLGTLRQSLASHGFAHIETTCSPGGTNSVLVASKIPFDMQDDRIAHDEERWLPVFIPSISLNVLCVHIPGGTDNKFKDGYGISGKKRKELLWDEVIRYARLHKEEHTVLLGDFNTGLKEDAQGTPFVLSDYIRVLKLEKYVDTWRYLHPKAKEFTWYTKRKNKETSISEDYNGFRLDYVFTSPPLRERITNAEHVHSVRVNGLSDHAIVLADIATAG